MSLNIAHVTHEAIHQVGGIGAVLKGLITADAYQTAVGRTVLVGPLYDTAGPPDSRLGPAGQVEYSSCDGRVDHPLAEKFRPVQHHFGVDVVYGRRCYDRDGASVSGTGHEGATATAEVVLIDVRRVQKHLVDGFKAHLWERFGIDSRAYEHVWDYEEWVRLAEPAIAVLRAIGAIGDAGPCVVIAHEFMGVPTALAARIFEPQRTRTVFYAHEVAPVRRIVEDHPGHDAMFYNVLSRALKRGHYVDDLFGPQDGYFKTPLVRAARHCNAIFAVGDYVRDELRFLGPEFAHAHIELTYNGIPHFETTVEQNHTSKTLLLEYADALLGWRPDFVFTHVTRMSRSKGLWRDVQVLAALEPRLRALGKTAVMFVLSCEVPRRPNEDVWKMEAEYGWPLAHREGGPDLTHGEAEFYARVQALNARARNTRIVFVNQFGWTRDACGALMPEAMEFWDIRRGSDLEFGQSIYEPFGIAQIEALPFGGICVFSSVCGCAGFVGRVLKGDSIANVVIANYTRMPEEFSDRDVLNLSGTVRRQIERAAIDDVVAALVERLPHSPADEERMLQTGAALAAQMSWDVVARDYVLPAVKRIVAS